jgi:hypothetical protein
MRFHLPLVLLVVATNCAPPPVIPIDPGPARVAPSSLDFGRVWLSRSEERTLEVTNPNRVALEVAASSAAPFFITPANATLAAGETAIFRVRFEPQVEGTITAELDVAGSVVTVTARAEQPPPCIASQACRVSAFDFEQGACVERDADDDTSCAPAFSCFAQAVCRSGQCVGTLTTCSDGNPCTVDACGEAGCVFIDDSLSCPVPVNPCLAPACDADAGGCTTVPVVDGTSCGPRTCSTADICLNAQCVTRPAPQTQACAEVVAGHPAGPGDVDGRRHTARFNNVESMIYDDDGTLYVADSPRIRRISPTGEVKTLAGSVPGSRDGFGAAAQFQRPFLIGFTAQRNLLVRDFVGFGVSGPLRQVSRAGLVSTLCAACLPPSGSPQRIAADGTIVGVISGTSSDALFFVSAAGQTTVVPLTNNAAFQFQLMGIQSLQPLRVCIAPGGSYDVGPVPTDGGAALLTQHAPFCEGARLGSTRVLADGGSETLAIEGAALDGPRTSVGVSSITAFARTPVAFNDGGYALFDPARFHVRRVDGDFMRTLAGPVPRQGLVDGMNSELLTSPSSIVRDGARAVFADGPTLRSLTGHVVTTHVFDAGAGEQFFDRLQLAVLDGGSIARLSPVLRTLVLYDAQSWQPTAEFGGLTFNSSGMLLERPTSVAQAADGALFISFTKAAPVSDGGITFIPFASAVRPAQLPNHAYVATRSSSGPLAIRGLFLLNDAGLTLLNPDDAGQPIGNVPTDFYEEAPGQLLGVSGKELVRIRLNPYRIETLLEFWETPTSLAPAPDGGVLVGITHAIVHVELR